MIERDLSTMANASFNVPPPVNEPISSYEPGSPERRDLQSTLERMRGEEVEIPVIIGGEEIRTGDVDKVVCPHDHGHVLATIHQGDACLLYTSPSPRDRTRSRMPSSA